MLKLCESRWMKLHDPIFGGVHWKPYCRNKSSKDIAYFFAKFLEICNNIGWTLTIHVNDVEFTFIMNLNEMPLILGIVYETVGASVLYSVVEDILHGTYIVTLDAQHIPYVHGGIYTFILNEIVFIG